MGVIATLTRRESNRKTARGPRQQKILDALKTGPMTARCLMQVLGYSDMNAVRPRLTELTQAGLIYEAGVLYDPLTRRNVTVWALKEE